MPRSMRHLLKIAAGLLAAACASSVQSLRPSREIAAGPWACDARLLADTTCRAELERVSAAADSALAAARAGWLIDTAAYATVRAQLARAVGDTAMRAQLARAMGDTALRVQLGRAMADTDMQARLGHARRELDSLLACPRSGKPSQHP